MNPVWIGTSWKMNKTLAEASTYARRLRDADVDRHAGIQRFVVPPFTSVREVKALLADTSVKVGAQTMHWAEQGAWTGEISASMLCDCGLDLVELGHSERREHFGETDETVGLKVETAVRHGLTPLICVGETLQQKQAGQADAVLEHQVQRALARVSSLPPAERDVPLLLAYEPVWAIGEAGVPASADYADERQAGIARVAEQVLGTRVPCLYGGSVDADNCVDLIRRRHIDGLFIGRAAWQIDGYLEILSRCRAAIVATE